jgi:hypothetical protein
MRRTIAIGTAAAAGVASLALVVAPAWAQAGTWLGGTRATSSTTATDPVCTGTGPNGGMGYGMRNGGANGSGNAPGNGPGMGYGRGNGGGPGAGMMAQDAVAQGTLTADQKTTLATMADEEKMAHDLYVALAAKYPELTQFARVATSETRHLTAVRSMLERYGIADPTAGKAAGEFATASIQSLYDKLLAGATSSTAALAAGVTVEKADIADLAAAKSGLTAPDVLNLYTHLSTASQHHLTAFGG